MGSSLQRHPVTLLTPPTVGAVERGTFLANLSDDAAKRLMAAGRVRRHPVGSMLFLEGDDSHGVLILMSGTVKLTVLALDGREVVLDLRGAGEILGEMSALDGAPRSATATVIEEAEILTIGLGRVSSAVHERRRSGGADAALDDRAVARRFAAATGARH